MGLVMGSPEPDMIFGDGVGTSLVRGPHSEHGVGLWCDVDAFRAAEEVACVGLKPSSEKDRIQPVEGPVLDGPVLDPRAKETYLKRCQKVDPLKSKAVSSGVLAASSWQIY